MYDQPSTLFQLCCLITEYGYGFEIVGVIIRDTFFADNHKPRKLCDIYNEDTRTADTISNSSERKDKESRLHEAPITSPGLDAFAHEKPSATEGLPCAQSPFNGRGTPTPAVLPPPPGNAKPKLWSLAEIATSSGSGNSSSQISGEDDCPVISTRVRSPSLSSQCHFLNNAMFPPHMYCTSSVYTSFTNCGSLGPLNGSGTGPATHLNGLNQSMSQRAEAFVRDRKR